MRIFFQLAFLAAVNASSVCPQALSDKALQTYVDLWRDEQVDSVRSLLPTLAARFSNKPETLFFQAVFELNGERANKTYEMILEKYPGSALADECLYRLIQSDYAAGVYQNIPLKLQSLRNKYPHSRFIKAAEQNFSYADSGSVKFNSTVQNKDNQGLAETTKKFKLQVGAFSQLKNAEELKEKLNRSGYAEVEFSEKTVNEKQLVLVWVGAFETKEEARKNGEVLKSRLQLNYTIVEK